MDSECAHIAHGGRPCLLETVRQEMRLRNYSHKTVKAYISCLRMFMAYLHPKHPREAT